MYREYGIQGRWPSPDLPRYMYKHGAVRIVRIGPLGPGAFNLADPQSLNRYAYALNNPTGSVDPLGLDCWSYTMSIGGQIVQTLSGSDAKGCPGSLDGTNPLGLVPSDMPWQPTGVPQIYAPTFHIVGPRPRLKRPQSQTPCTQLQRAAGLIAAQLKSNGESLGLLALGGGLVSAFLTAGEEATAGLDTPFTLTAYHATQIFAALSILDFGASAAFESYASGGSPAALENFAWDQFASLAGGFAAEATKIPFLSRFAEPLADLAGRAAALANQTEGVCR